MTKGSNKQPSKQLYRVYPSAIMTKKIKRMTESYKSYRGIYDKVSPEERGNIAYFASSFESNARAETSDKTS